MQFTRKFAAWTAVAALGAAGLFAAETSQARQQWHGRGRFGHFMSELNLTDAQKAQAKSIFQGARQSAQPVRQQLMETRKSLRAAIKANDAAQIQQLSATEGHEIGQLAAIRGSAFAKVYQTLTPDQKQKADALEQARHARHQGQRPKPGANS
jgi:Spy/CpxP family protein refolding chaperone